MLLIKPMLGKWPTHTPLYLSLSFSKTKWLSFATVSLKGQLCTLFTLKRLDFSA